MICVRKFVILICVYSEVPDYHHKSHISSHPIDCALQAPLKKMLLFVALLAISCPLQAILTSAETPIPNRDTALFDLDGRAEERQMRAHSKKLLARLNASTDAFSESVRVLLEDKPLAKPSPWLALLSPNVVSQFLLWCSVILLGLGMARERWARGKRERELWEMQSPSILTDIPPI